MIHNGGESPVHFRHRRSSSTAFFAHPTDNIKHWACGLLNEHYLLYFSFILPFATTRPCLSQASILLPLCKKTSHLHPRSLLSYTAINTSLHAPLVVSSLAGNYYIERDSTHTVFTHTCVRPTHALMTPLDLVKCRLQVREIYHFTCYWIGSSCMHIGETRPL